MPSFSLDLVVDPTSATPTAASFTATVTFFFTGTAPTGTLTLYVDGIAATLPIAITDTSQAIGVALSNPATPGTYSVLARYSGDSNWAGPVDSNTATFTVTGTTAPVTQARARAACSFVAGAAPSRADREIGVQAAEGFQVTSIPMLSAGSGQYDAHTVATLFGKVAGVPTRQDLTVTLDDVGGIAGLAGFDGTTVWDKVPTVCITRWDGDAPGANFLGY